MMMMIMLSMLFISSLQPMFMVMSLILIIFIYSYLVNLMLGDYWFSYALVMVMLSGVLVVFTYMVSLIPNENFESYNLLYMMSMLLFIVGGFYLYIYKSKCSLYSLYLWGSFISIFNMFMLMFLLMVMLMVVWFSYIGCGALRNN